MNALRKTMKKTCNKIECEGIICPNYGKETVMPKKKKKGKKEGEDYIRL